jgi:multiple sugar transport system substrate-binding protein
MNKKLIILPIFLGLVVTGCGASNSSTTSQNNRPVTLSYADWANQDINQKLIDAFMAKYPHITVELRQDITGAGDAFTGNLVTAAQAGLLPDVFATDNVPTVINAGLTLDIAQYWDNDLDAELVYDNIALAGVYDGKRYAMPSFQFLKGILINLDIFENADLQSVPGRYRIDNDGYPVKDWTFQEFINIAKDITNFDLVNTQNLVVGTDLWFGLPDFQQVWPTMENAATQYDTWDGASFNYTSPAWISAMEEKVRFANLRDGTVSIFNTEDFENTPELQTFLISSGYAAMKIEGSWQLPLVKDAKDNRGFDLGFWPYPRGSAGFFPPTILDFQAVSSQTQYPEEAYLLAKWMTYGREGWLARLEIMEEAQAEDLANGLTPNYLDRYPVADYPDVWERVYGLVEGVEGIDVIFDNIANSKPDLDKWLPGYKDFWAWVYSAENPWNWGNLATEGPNAVPTYASEWQKQIMIFVARGLNQEV